MYCIGLIDDEEKQLKKIKRTIKTNLGLNRECLFKSYVISDNAADVIPDVFEQVMNDIRNNILSSLIIDYKIMVKTAKIKGTDIFCQIKEEVPKFPIIMLTDIVGESTEPEFIDADKVYRKKDFYKLESDYSKEKVANIFDSMQKFINQRDKLQLNIEALKRKLTEGSSYVEVVGEILALENQLSAFVPTDQSQIDKILDTNKLREIVALIEDAKVLME